MAFERYIEYNEYLELGGKVSEDAFVVLERKAQRWLDYFTFDRVKYLTRIPDEVKEVLVEFIDRLQEYSDQTMDGQLISKYSNGVEDITYSRSTESDVKNAMGKIAIEWLPDYLTNRSLKFDVREYLQSESNNT